MVDVVPVLRVGAAAKACAFAAFGLPRERLFDFFPVGGIEAEGFGIAPANPAAQLGQAFGLEGLDQAVLFGFDCGQGRQGLTLQLHIALLFIEREAAQGLREVLPDLLNGLLLFPGGARLQVAG